MATDTRSLRFDSKDDPQRWRVLQAVEETALDIAKKHEYPPSLWVRVQHGSGHYSRRSVAEAKAVADRNGWSPSTIDLDVNREFRDPTMPHMSYPDSWVTGRLGSGPNRQIEVEVTGTSEVDVNGVFSLLESAVNKAKRSSTDGSATHHASAVVRWWHWLLNHPLPVQILGGAGAVGLVALIVWAWAAMR